MGDKQELQAVCEECEKNEATLRCEACEQSVCQRCCEILHPRKPYGVDDEHYEEGRIRPWQPGDSSGCVSLEYATISEWPISEEEAATHRNLSEPSALQCPKINDVRSKAENHYMHGLRFKTRDFVVFNLARNAEITMEDFPTSRSSSPPWRDVEVVGVVRSVAGRKLKPSVSTLRKGDLHENYYIIEAIGLVEGDYTSLVDKQMQVEATKSFNTKIMKGAHPGPMAEIMKKAWDLEKRIRRESEDTEDFQRHRIDLAGSNCAFLCIPETDLWDPRDKQSEFEKWRREWCEVILLSAFRRFLQHNAKPRFLLWKDIVESCRRKEQGVHAVKIQSCFRRHLQRDTLQFLGDELLHERWVEGRTLHKDFHYITEQLGQVSAYTLNNKDFFATMSEVKRWMTVRKKTARKLIKYINRRAFDNQKIAFSRWREWYLALQPPHIDVNENELTWYGIGEETVLPEFHPAHGLTRLAKLPDIWAKRAPNGEIVVEEASRYNSFRATFAGPTDDSSWVVQGIIAMGTYPYGTARKKKMGETSGVLAAEQLVTAGIGTFVNLMEDHEIEKFEKSHQLTPLEDNLRSAYTAVQGTMKNLLSQSENALMTAETDLKAFFEKYKGKKVTPEIKLQTRQKLAASKVAYEAVNRMRSALAKVPSEFNYLRFPMKRAGTPTFRSLLSNLKTLEARVREGHNLYVFSADGHGRAGLVAGCLLGRIYGCPISETVGRLQFYHDCRLSLVNEDLKASCPATSEQNNLLYEILLHNEPAYCPYIRITGPPTDVCKRKDVQIRKRGCGDPILCGEIQSVSDVDIVDYSETQKWLRTP